MSTFLAIARREADTTAAVLDSAARAVSSGAPLPPELVPALTRYGDHRDAVLSALGEFTAIPPDSTFDAMRACLDNAREVEHRRLAEQARAEELAEVDRQIQDLQARRAGLLSDSAKAPPRPPQPPTTEPPTTQPATANPLTAAPAAAEQPPAEPPAAKPPATAPATAEQPPANPPAAKPPATAPATAEQLPANPPAADPPAAAQAAAEQLPADPPAPAPPPPAPPAPTDPPAADEHVETDVQTDERAAVRTNKRVDVQTSERADERTNVQANERGDVQTDERADLQTEERVEEQVEVASTTTPADAASTPLDAGKAPTDAASTPMDAANTPTNAANTPTKAASTPTDAANTPAGAANTPTKAASTPTDAANTPAGAANTPTNAANTPTNAANTPTNAANTPAGAANTPTDVGNTPADAASTPADELDHGFPWEHGDPPLAVELVQANRLVEAYWVTTMSGEPDLRASVIRFAIAAFGAQDGTDATAIQASLDVDSQALHLDSDAAAVVTAALLRVALVAGWAHPLLSQIPAELPLPEKWRELLEAGVATARSGYRFDQSIALGGARQDNGIAAQTDLSRRAEMLLSDLPKRKNTYERATRVLRRLAMTGQPLEQVLRAVIRWANDNDADALVTAVETLRACGTDDDMIEAADAAVRTPKQAKEPIISTALRGLRRAIDEVRAIVQDAEVVNVRLMTSAPSEAVLHQLARLIDEVRDTDLPPGMAGAAMRLLRSWLREPSAARQPANGATADGVPGVDVLLPLADLPRDADGLPDRADHRVPGILASLTKPIDLAAAVGAYAAQGDLLRAERVVELLEDGMWPGAANPAVLRDEVAAARSTWDQRHRVAFLETGDLFARIRGQNLLDQNSESDFGRRLEALSTVSDGAYDRAMTGLSALKALLRDNQKEHVRTLGESLRELRPSSGSDRARIQALLDEGDTVTAAEFLSFLRAGKELPTHSAPATQEVGTFAALLTTGAERGYLTTRASARQWAELASEMADGRELAQSASLGIDDWDSFADRKSYQSDRMAAAIRSILNTLGLQCANRPRELDPKARRGFRRFRVPGKPADGSYVSLLGSAATDYTITLVTEERRGRSVLADLGHEDAGRANIVLYLHPLDLAARHSLAREAPNSPIQAIVIDPAVLGWVAACSPGSWRATQRVTLPWTAMNPYTPFVAGLVPPEIFVGREDELAAVTDPSGGLFLYGGRQLGKSALLRRVEATFNDGLRHAVYLDLKGRGIGEAEPANRIWRELVVELKQRGVLGSEVSNDAPSDEVVTRIREWLDVNQGRRLLLLADEADAFLTADSRAFPSAGGAGHFPNVLRLKELMESTGRRFKVVFAGLHQVQRFGHLSNVPLVHGGPDILVGPLDQPNARKLVEEPLLALGYAFEKPELVWRLLSATNYQASLIQIFCDELVTTLHKRAWQAQTIPVPITEDDVENVRASDRVRDRIAERLRITINLEDRYRVLALVIASLSLNDSFGTAYEPTELLKDARVYWPEGFDDLNVSQVRIYLDEMVGLGLLMQLPGESRYVVRSPNVINMLGTKEELERELDETDFVLPYEYNPREARRLLRIEDDRQFRSPLTDGQLAELLRSNDTSLITGTPALGIERAATAVQEYAETRGNTVEVCRSLDEVVAVTRSTHRTSTTVVIADLRGTRRSEIQDVMAALKGASVIAAVIADPDDLAFCGQHTENDPVSPQRWTSSAIRSWPECPFDSVESRRDLIEETGGWPELVERVIRKVTRGETQAQALDDVRQICASPEQARTMVESAGLDDAMLQRLAPWVDLMLPGDPMPLIPADIAEVLEVDLVAANDFLAELSLLDVLDVTDGSKATADRSHGVALNRVIHRCVATIRERG